MIPIKDMQFVTVKKDGDTIVRGKLSFEAEYRISRHEMESTSFDIVVDVKEKMKASVWRKTYGELTAPLRELEYHALHSAMLGQEMRVRELVDQLRALLSPQNTKAEPRAQRE